MAKISVYLNGQASQGNSRYQASDFQKFFFRHELLVNAPQSVEELNDKLARDIEDGVDYIFSVGGDGTANTISQNLIGKKVKLMVLPAGTANDFANEVGVSGSLKRISQIFHAQTTREVDAIKINGRYMISNGGIGMASEVAKTVNDMRKKSPFFKKMMKTFGKETYSLVYAQHMLGRSFKTRRLFIESPDSPLLDGRIDSALVLVNNQAMIGGKFNVAPFTRNDDGKINVTLFLHRNKMDLMKCTLMMMAGHYPKNDPNLVSFETDKVTINSLDGKPLEFFGDGETFEPNPILDISVSHKALEVCTYKGDDLICSSYPLDKIEMIQ
jgi:diacylglycerol kinase family enzyme